MIEVRIYVPESDRWYIVQCSHATLNELRKELADSVYTVKFPK